MEGILLRAIQWMRNKRYIGRTNIDNNKLGEPIIKLEFEMVSKELKNNKAPDVDGIQAEIFKFAGETQKPSYLS